MAKMVLVLKCGDTVAAKKLYEQLKIDLQELATKHKQPALIYDGILLDGICDKLEGNIDSAKEKLNDVLINTTDEGNRIRARRELEGLW